MPSKVPKRPYLDSDVFIGWIKGERIPEKDAGGNEVVTDRGKIAESILTLAERQVFPIVISALTLAEVHKKRGKEKLVGDEDQNVLEYFKHDFVNVVPVDRAIGEAANRLCRKYEKEGLSPNDAIHMACAKQAGCDILLSWDKVLNAISDPDIPTERPKILDLTPPQQELELVPAEDNEDESPAGNKERIEPQTTELSGSSDGHPEGTTGTEAAKTESREAPNPSAEAVAGTDPDAGPKAEPPGGAGPAGCSDGPKPVVDATGVEPTSAEPQGTTPAKSEGNPPLTH